MQTVAKQLALHDPDEPQWMILWAFATRRADSIDHDFPISLDGDG